MKLERDEVITIAGLPIQPPGAGRFCVLPVECTAALERSFPCQHPAGLCVWQMGKLRHGVTSRWEVMRVKSV